MYKIENLDMRPLWDILPKKNKKQTNKVVSSVVFQNFTDPRKKSHKFKIHQQFLIQVLSILKLPIQCVPYYSLLSRTVFTIHGKCVGILTSYSKVWAQLDKSYFSSWHTSKIRVNVSWMFFSNYYNTRSLWIQMELHI